MWRGRRRSRHRRRSTSIPAMKVRSDRVLRSLSTLSLASETSARAGSLSGGDLITLSLSLSARVAGATVVNGVIGHCRPSQINKLDWLYN